MNLSVVEKVIPLQQVQFKDEAKSSSNSGKGEDMKNNNRD